MPENIAVLDSPIVIRFDGLETENHEIEMSSLAESLRGLSRIIGVTANFAVTQRFVQHRDALSVRVTVKPPEAHCFEISAWVSWASQNPLISTTIGGLFATLITYIFKRAAGQRAEMRELRGALDLAIKELGTKDQNVVERLLDTVDKMADALRPAVKQAVAPIGETASTLSIGTPSDKRMLVVDAADKAAITSETPVDIGDEQTYHVIITEINFDTATARVALSDDTEVRVPATITDPVFGVPNNPYALAAAAHRTLTVRAKATIRDGLIEKLFISNTA